MKIATIAEGLAAKKRLNKMFGNIANEKRRKLLWPYINWPLEEFWDFIKLCFKKQKDHK